MMNSLLFALFRPKSEYTELDEDSCKQIAIVELL